MKSSKLKVGGSKAKRVSKPRTSNLKPRTSGPLSIRASYDAAQQGRRLYLWNPGRPGPNQAILANLELLRSRSRDAVRNNGWIRKGINSWVSNEIGTGIIPRAVSPDQDFNAACDALWERWIKHADADGLLDYYGLTALCCRARKEAGEVFVRYRLRPDDASLAVPFQLQILEPEFCPTGENRLLSGGRRVRAGVEFNGIGQRMAYWMYRSHPGDQFFFSDNLTLVPVPADFVLHHFAPLRPGQIRGIPETVQALISAKIFDEYEDAEAQRKRDKAAYTGVLRRQSYDDNDYQYDPFTGAALETDSAGVGIQNVQGGSLIQLLPGEDVTMFDGDVTGGGYADFIRHELLRLFSAMDIPYELGSGDLSKVNDRLMRVVLNEFHRILEQSQWHLTVPQISQPVREFFIRMAVLSGKLDAPGFESDPDIYFETAWGPQRWQYLNPLQDVEADAAEIEAGLSSRKRKVAERGEAVEDIDRENSEDKERADSLGLTYGASGSSAAASDPSSQDPAQQAAGARLRQFREINAELY